MTKSFPVLTTLVLFSVSTSLATAQEKYVTIRARHTGLVLDVANFGKQDAPTNTAAYVGQANQQ